MPPHARLAAATAALAAPLLGACDRAAGASTTRTTARSHLQPPSPFRYPLRRHRRHPRGLAYAPRFINMLSWADAPLLEDGRSMSDVVQGVNSRIGTVRFTMSEDNIRPKIAPPTPWPPNPDRSG